MTSVSDNYKNTNRPSCCVDFKEISRSEKAEVLNAIDYLEEKGYLKTTTQGSGFIQFKLTAFGIDFINNDLKENTVTPVVQGNNSIYVSGSNNQITDNYNSITMEIKHADLDESQKKLLEQLISDMKNLPSKKEKESKIKQFLRDVAADTLSGTATASLSLLLTQLFSNL